MHGMIVCATRQSRRVTFLAGDWALVSGHDLDFQSPAHEANKLAAVDMPMIGNNVHLWLPILTSPAILPVLLFDCAPTSAAKILVLISCGSLRLSNLWRTLACLLLSVAGRCDVVLRVPRCIRPYAMMRRLRRQIDLLA
jgi:hypothetical protein